MASAKLDPLDAVIIKELLEDARKSFSEIAKKNGVTTNTVCDHFSELEKRGVILGSTIQMDYRRFGFNAVASLQIEVQPHQATQLLEYFASFQDKYLAFPIRDPKVNIVVIAALENLHKLDQLKNEIRRQVHVSGLRTHVWMGIRNIPENLQLLPHEKPIGKASEVPQTKDKQDVETVIDQTDREIAEILAKDSRQSFRKIAEKIGISTDTVARRYKKLKQNNAIKASIQIDPSKIGYKALLVVYLAANAQIDSSEIVDSLLKIPDLTLIIKQSGEYDMFVNFLIRDVEQFLAVQDELLSLPGLTKLDMRIVKIAIPWIGFREYISTF